jgi:hypothetical protein
MAYLFLAGVGTDRVLIRKEGRQVVDSGCRVRSYPRGGWAYAQVFVYSSQRIPKDNLTGLS